MLQEMKGEITMKFMKKHLLLSVFVVLLAFTPFLPSGQVQAGTLPELIWTDSSLSRIFIEVQYLGNIYGNEWHLVAYSSWPVGNVTIGMRTYDSHYGGDYGFQIWADGTGWNQHGFFGPWYGSGSSSYAVDCNGIPWTGTLLTQPPAVSSSTDSGCGKE
jgi:hypothetical protein